MNAQCQGQREFEEKCKDLKFTKTQVDNCMTQYNIFNTDKQGGRICSVTEGKCEGSNRACLWRPDSELCSRLTSENVTSPDQRWSLPNFDPRLSKLLEQHPGLKTDLFNRCFNGNQKLAEEGAKAGEDYRDCVQEKSCARSRSEFDWHESAGLKRPAEEEVCDMLCKSRIGCTNGPWGADGVEDYCKKKCVGDKTELDAKIPTSGNHKDAKPTEKFAELAHVLQASATAV